MVSLIPSRANSIHCGNPFRKKYLRAKSENDGAPLSHRARFVFLVIIYLAKMVFTRANIIFYGNLSRKKSGCAREVEVCARYVFSTAVYLAKKYLRGDIKKVARE